MTPEILVPLLVAIIGSGLALVANIIGKRADHKAISEQAARDTLDDVWEQRLAFRDEQISSLKAQVTELIAEVRRLKDEIQLQGGGA